MRGGGGGGGAGAGGAAAVHNLVLLPVVLDCVLRTVHRLAAVPCWWLICQSQQAACAGGAVQEALWRPAVHVAGTCVGLPATGAVAVGQLVMLVAWRGRCMYVLSSCCCCWLCWLAAGTSQAACFMCIILSSAMHQVVPPGRAVSWVQ